MANNLFKKKMDIYRHGIKLMPNNNNCKILDPPQFSLPTTFKGAQVWDFDILDFNDFFIMKSIFVGDLRAEIKFLHFLQMDEILAIFFSYRMRRLR